MDDHYRPARSCLDITQIDEANCRRRKVPAQPAACCRSRTLLCKEGSSASSQCSAASAAPACSTRDDGDAVDRRDGGHLAFGDRHATAVCLDATQLLRATDIDFSAFARRSALSFRL
jgi:hypothetical protein